MKDKKAIIRMLVGIAAVGFVACGGGGDSDGCSLFDCVDYDYRFCEECDAQNKVAYECNYHVTEFYGDTSGAVERQYRLTGCYDSVEQAEIACVNACQGFYECLSYTVGEFFCDGVDNCNPGTTPVPLVTPDCSDWAPAAAISIDPASGIRELEWGFWYGIMSDPYLLACETTTVTPNVASPGFTVSNVTSGSLADLLGGQNGAVLGSLYGQSLSGLSDVATVATSLPNVTRFELVVSRGGRLVTLAFVVQ